MPILRCVLLFLAAGGVARAADAPPLLLSHGYSPIGIVFDRTPATPKTLPFPTWTVSAEWMEKGTFIEMMTPKEMPRAVSLSISSHAVSTNEKENEPLARDPVKGEMLLHPNGARRLTGM